MNKTLVIIGAGGHARVCFEIAQEMKKWTNYIILDDESQNEHFEIAGPIKDIGLYDNADFFIAIGKNELRKRYHEILVNEEKNIVTLIHPKAIISSTVEIGNGTVVMPGVIINATSKVGKSCILNTSCTIDHDNRIDNYVHISPGATLSGNVTVGDCCWLGSNSTIINNISIVKNSVIGAGSTVLQEIVKSGVYIGSPAKQKTVEEIKDD